MSFIKYDSAQQEKIITEVDTLNTDLEELKGLFEGFSSHNLSADRSYVPSTNPDGTEATLQDQSLLSQINSYNGAVAQICGMATTISGAEIKGRITKIKEALVAIDAAIVEFNSTNISLKDALESQDGITVDDEGIVYFTVGEDKYRLADLVNCFYTELGMDMNAAVSIGVLADGKTDIDVDKMIKATIESNDTLTNDLLGAGFFGVASQADIDATAEAAGVSSYMSKDAASIMGEMDFSKFAYEGMSESELEILKKALLGQTGSSLALSGAWSSAMMLSAYGMNNKTNEEQVTEAPTTTSTTPPPGGSSYYGGGGSTEAPTIPIELVQISSEPIPELITVELDFDELALEKFEALGEEQLNAMYNEITTEVMTLFDSSDKTLLIQKLSDYGYSQNDIDMIILDREMAINACIAGERRALLAEYAQGLAQEGGLTDFDTSYDGELTYGIDDSSNYVYALGDKDVADAYEDYAAARTEYYEAVNLTNTSIVEAQTAKAELDTLTAEIVKTSTDDMTKWTEEQLTQYNEAVTKYNTTLQASLDNTKALEELKLKFDTAKEEYTEVREEYIESLNEINDDLELGIVDVPAVEYLDGGTINTGVDGPVIESVDYTVANTQSTPAVENLNGSDQPIVENANNTTVNQIETVNVATNTTNTTNTADSNVTVNEVLDLPVLNNSIQSADNGLNLTETTFDVSDFHINF